MHLKVKCGSPVYGATVGKLGVLTFPAATNQAVCAITPYSQLDKYYLFYWLLNIRNDLINASFGGAQPNISQTVIRNIELPLPSIAEQHQIASRIKAQLAEVEAARKTSEMQLAEIKRLPPRLLAQAFKL